jgi:hypothetical protein
MSAQHTPEPQIRVYEFAIERGFSFDYIEVRAVSLPWARQKLRDALTAEQYESATSIELCSERTA